MDAFQFLRTEHRKAAQLLRRLKTASEIADRDRLFRELKQELDTDEQVEREFFYPPLLKKEATADAAGGGIQDLDQLHELLGAMAIMPKQGPEWSAKVDQLQQAVEGHIKKEEDGVFRKALGIFNKDQREDLGERMRSRKMRLIQGGAASATAETRAGARREAPVQETAGAAHEEREHAAGPGGARERVSRETAGAAADTAGDAMRNVEQLTRVAKEQSKGFAAAQARYLAGQVGGLADAVRQTAGNLNKDEQAEMAAYLKRAAGGLDRLSGALEEGDVDEMVARSSKFARRQPAVFMGGAVMMGFLLTRFLKSSEERSDQRR